MLSKTEDHDIFQETGLSTPSFRRENRGQRASMIPNDILWTANAVQEKIYLGEE
jgi:hypothetical protein